MTFALNQQSVVVNEADCLLFAGYRRRGQLDEDEVYQQQLGNGGLQQHQAGRRFYSVDLKLAEARMTMTNQLPHPAL